jgi:DNA mismatch endonuclease Vsr
MKRATAVPDIPEARRRIMRAIRSRDTGPELIVRKLLHRSGYRFRLHRRDLPGTPDLVFPSRRAAIQVHGCFWHQHVGCPHANIPATRQSYWLPKLGRNKQRDLESAERLVAAGWRYLVIWECELCNPQEVLRSAVAFLGPPTAAGAVQTNGRKFELR